MEVPGWVTDTSDAEFQKDAVRIRQRILDDIPQATVIIADNVCEFFYAENPKEIWTIADFPCCAPDGKTLDRDEATVTDSLRGLGY